jgi:hypothetical protein
LEATKIVSITDVYGYSAAKFQDQSPVDLSMFTSLEQVRVCGDWKWVRSSKDLAGVTLRELAGNPDLEVFFVPTEVSWIGPDNTLKINWG